MMQHREGTYAGFTKRYGVHHLVYYEFHEVMDDAITRETRIKKWQRAWKVRLIHATNPEWLDLFDPEEGIKEPPADVARRYREP